MAHRTALTMEDAERIAQRNKDGEFLWSLAQEYDVSAVAVNNAIRRTGNEPIKHSQSRPRPLLISEAISQKMADMYLLDGKTIKQISKEYGFGTKAVRNALIRENVVFRNVGYSERIPEAEIVDAWVQMYADGSTVKEIASQHSTSPAKVSKFLKRRGVTPSRSRSGKRNKEWTERRRVGPGGYVKIKLHPEDQWYEYTSDLEYILEHRHVMMNVLGRPLTKEETVHHIDGNRQNNDPSNLQLRTGRHGKGVKHECGDCGSHNIVPVKI